MPFYPTNKKARWLRVFRTRGCLQQPGGCSQEPSAVAVGHLWCKAWKERRSILVPSVGFGDRWCGGQRGEPELGVQQSCLASLCSCDQLWLHVPHRLLAVPSSPVPPPSPQQGLGESCLVRTERMVEGRKKEEDQGRDWSKEEIRECYASLGKKSPLRPAKWQLPFPGEDNNPP